MANSIVDYFKDGKNLDTPEGLNLVSEADEATLQEAAQDPEVGPALARMSDKSQDVYLRRKIYKALST